MAGINLGTRGTQHPRTARLLLMIGLTALLGIAGAQAADAGQPATPRMTVRPDPDARVVPPRAPQASRLCNSTGDEGYYAIASQNFEGGFDAYDSVGAQSCTLISRKAVITGVYVVGTYFDGGGPARSETVIFWADAGGLPGIILNEQTVVADDPGTGAFDIQLRPLKIRKLSNPSFWFTVQINMDFGTNGQWSWWASQTAHGLPDVWENPGNGFELCAAWCALDTLLSGTTSFIAALEAGTARGN